MLSYNALASSGVLAAVLLATVSPVVVQAQSGARGGDKNKIASLAKINTYHTTLFAYFLEKLASTSDGEGTLLDHVIILYGSAISEGNRHDIRNLPILLAGGGAGLIKSGRHIKYPDETQRLTNLQLTLLNKLRVPTEMFGDSTGEQLRELSDL